MKRRAGYAVCVLAILLVGMVSSCYGEDNEIAVLKQQVRELQERVKVLEAERAERMVQPATAAAVVAAQPLQELKDRVKAVELQQEAQQQEEKPAQGLLSKMGDKVEVGGEIRVLFAQNESPDPTGINPSTYMPTSDYGRFTLDKLRLKVNVKPTDKIELKTKIDFEGEDDKITVKEAYVQFSDLMPFVDRVSAGLEERFIKMERYTHTSPFARTAFWKYADAGLQYKGKYKSLYWLASLTNGAILNNKEFGEDDSTMNQIVRDDKGWTDFNTNKQVGLGLGYKADFDRYGKADLLAFTYLSELPEGLANDNDGHDWGFLITNNDGDAISANPPRTNFPGSPRDFNANKRFQCRLGGNVVYSYDDLELSGQWIYAQDSFLRRYVWFVQGTYIYDTNFGLLKAIQPLVRYEEYLVRWGHDYRCPLTWDRFRWTTALIGHLVKRDSVLLKFEYNFNDSTTGRGDAPRNDEFLAALWYKF